MSGKGAVRGRERERGVRQERIDTGVPGSDGDGSSGRPAGVVLRGKTWGSVLRDRYCWRLGFTLAVPRRLTHLNLFALDRAEQARVKNPLRGLAEVCGARYSRDVVLIDIARAGPEIPGIVLDLGGPRVNTDSATPSDYVLSCSADSRGIGASWDQYNMVGVFIKFDTKRGLSRDLQAVLLDF